MTKNDVVTTAEAPRDPGAVDVTRGEFDALKQRVDQVEGIAERIERAAISWYSSPAGKVVRTVLWGAFVGWLAQKNIHIAGIN